MSSTLLLLPTFEFPAPPRSTTSIQRRSVHRRRRPRGPDHLSSRLVEHLRRQQRRHQLHSKAKPLHHLVLHLRHETGSPLPIDGGGNHSSTRILQLQRSHGHFHIGIGRIDANVERVPDLDDPLRDFVSVRVTAVRFNRFGDFYDEFVVQDFGLGDGESIQRELGRVREVNVGHDVVFDGSQALSIHDVVFDHAVAVEDVHASAEEFVVIAALLDVQCDPLSDIHACGDLLLVIWEEDLARGGTVEIAVRGARSQEHFGRGGVAGGGVEGALEEGGEGEVDGAGVEGEGVDEGLGLRECQH
mmetsp:Transcript_20221/g.41296  ORF Transcript_20221/g.41296 Transcript_20221/m.41296 type:complete len:301 (-) Transcript_20221:92-994(-)